MKTQKAGTRRPRVVQWILLPATERDERRVMSSGGAATAALAGRGNRITDSDGTDYQLILPQLPTGSIVLNTVFLHGDVRARPYRVEDFRDALVPTGLLPDVVALGAYQVNHVWAVTLNGAEATRRLLAFKELKVKNRRCVIIDPLDHQVRLRLHWLLHGVADENVRSALAAFGTVMDVSREGLRVQGMSDKGSMTRTVVLKLKKGMTVEDLPHQIRVGGELALVVAPGRPMQCLRCHGTGHVRRECKVPRCSNCRRFGHEDSQCVRTYASAMSPGERDEAEHLMDATEAEDAAKGTGEPLPTAVAEQAALAGEPQDTSVERPREPSPGPPLVQQSVDKSGASTHALPSLSSKGQEPPASDASVTTDTGTATKRTHEVSGDHDDQELASSVDEPPVKAVQGRRATFKPRPNVNAERKPADKPPPSRSESRQPDGPGGV
ncbi:uncharacterized protein LOC144098071 [Amblyomma americanum]